MIGKIRNWDRETISKWNLYRFPDNTRNKQLRKIEGEINEFNRETVRSKKLEELADVYITFAGLARFTKIGAFVCKLFEQMPDFEILREQIYAKMEINNRRVFDKNMHHIEAAALPELKSKEEKHCGVRTAEVEYIAVTKDFHQWKQDTNGRWCREAEPVTFKVIKN